MTDGTPQVSIKDWMRKVDVELERLDDKWQRSVDDIKSTIKAEISELKAEQLADFRRRLEEGYKDLRVFEARVKEIEMEQARWLASAGAVNWLIRFIFAIIGAVVAVVGYEIGKH